MNHQRRFRAFPAVAMFLILCGASTGAPGAPRSVAMISIDGLRPDYVTDPSHHLHIPNLQQILETGVHAQSVRGVLPTVTYPSHTTLLTGVWPSKHGIWNNVAFDPLGVNLEGWYWYSQDIRVPTLWDAATQAKLTVGSVSWPVSVGARSVQYLIPEVWRAVTPDDLKLVRALSTPGLFSEFEPVLGPYVSNIEAGVAGDWSRTHYAERIIREKHTRFTTVHLAALDHIEHQSGPFSAEANAALEAIDEMVGVLAKAVRDQTPSAAVCIVSDHGFARIDHQVDLRAAFVNAGLITPNPHRTTARSPAVSDWKADAWAAGGSYLIVLKDRTDAATRNAVGKLLRDFASDPANGIERVLDRDGIAQLGGDPEADFAVDLKIGFSAGSALDGPVVRAIKPGGTHGYAPTHQEMRAAFFISGDSIRKGVNVGDIDMRSIAPTIAKYLGLRLPSADLPPLDVEK
jgi:predicted AlkP superfamily pyrophosphatase or phosphodiesterase